MIKENIDEFEKYKFTGVATVQLFDEKGELVEEVVKKNAVNSRMGNYYYSVMKTGCIWGYTSATYYRSIDCNSWDTLRLTHSRTIDSYNPHDCFSYSTYGYAHLYTPYSGGATDRGTINVKETTYNLYNGAMNRKNYVPYINFVVDFPTHAGNTTFDTIMITGKNPHIEDLNDYSKFYFFDSYISKASIVHNDKAYAPYGNQMLRMGSKWDKTSEFKAIDLFPSDSNKNHYVYHSFYNNRLYVFANNVSTGQLDLLEVLNYEGDSPSVVTVKTNVETDSTYNYIADIVVRDGKIFIMRGKNGTRELRITVLSLSNYTKIHTHDFTTSRTYTKQFSGWSNQKDSMAFNLKNRIAFYIRDSENYGSSQRIDIILSDYSHVQWGITNTGYSSDRVYACRFSNAYGVRISSDGHQDKHSRQIARVSPYSATSVSHIVKLDAPITKTETNTMKIQYRVEFENSLEGSVPYADEFGNTWG